MANNINPKVTVLLPAYNAALYIKEAMDSILNQSYLDFEFLIINDGSKDETDDVIKSFKDKRIVYINDGTNKGIVERLNQGLDMAKGEYIVRMDADDICFPERIAKQVKFMDENPEVGICGTWSRTFGEGITSWETKYPTTHQDIKVHYLFSIAISHPTAIFRKSLFDKYKLRYSTDAKHFEDYLLFSNALDYFKFANIPEILFNYRVSKTQISTVYSKEQSIGALKVRRIVLGKLGIKPTDQELELHINLANFNYQNNLDKYIETVKWLNKIWQANKSSHYYSNKSLRKIIYPRWLEISKQNRQYGFRTLYWFLNNQMFRFDLSIKSIKLMLKFIANGLKNIVKS